MEDILLRDIGVQYIEGYSFINYQIFALEPYPSPSRTQISAHQFRSCRIGSASVIQRGGLAFSDPCLRCIWVFEKPTDRAVNSESPHVDTHKPPPGLVPVAENASFRLLITGSLYTPSLGRRNQNPGATKETSAKPGPDGIATHEPAPSRVYSMFISAVVSSISFVLARDHSMVPLNFRTFLAPHRSPGNCFSGPTSIRAAKCLVSLDVSLSNLGVLIVSFQASATSLWDHIGSLSLRTVYPEADSRVIRLAPCGVLARRYADRNSHDAATDIPDEEQWKSLAVAILETSGISLPNLDRDDSWTQLWLPKPRLKNNQTFGSRMCWWPTALCFVPLEAEFGFSSHLIGFTDRSSYVNFPQDLGVGVSKVSGLASVWMSSLLDNVDIGVSIEPAASVPVTAPAPASAPARAPPVRRRSCDAAAILYGDGYVFDDRPVTDKDWLSTLYPSPPEEGHDEDEEEKHRSDASSRVTYSSAQAQHARCVKPTSNVCSPAEGGRSTVGYHLDSETAMAIDPQAITPYSLPPSGDSKPVSINRGTKISTSGLGSERTHPNGLRTVSTPVWPTSFVNSPAPTISDSGSVAHEIDAKYRPGGRFGFEIDYKAPEVKTIQDLREAAKRITTPKSPVVVSVPTLNDLGFGGLATSVDALDSEDDDSEYTDDDKLFTVFPQSYVPTTPTTTHRGVLMPSSLIHRSDNVTDLTLRFIDVLHPDTFSWPLTLCPLSDDGPVLPLYDERPLQPADMVAVMQLIADQRAFSTIAPANGLSRPSPLPNRAHISAIFRQAVRAATKTAFSERKVCDLLHYLGIHDHIPNVGSITNIKLAMRRIMGLAETQLELSEFVFAIPVPNIRVRRGNSLWDLSAAAIPFWDTLGLGPAGGPKNVTACSLVPRMFDRRMSPVPLADLVGRFLCKLGASYQSCRLGNHTFDGRLGLGSDDIVEYSLFPTAGSDDLISVAKAMGKSLARLSIRANQATKANQPSEYYVVYIVDPYETPDSIRQCCIAYYALSNAFDAMLAKCMDPETETSVSQLALQILPLSFIAENPQSVFGEHDPLARLAREVYTRCQTGEASQYPQHLGIATSAPILLEEPLPRMLAFKGERSGVPPSLVQDHLHLHLGYSRSVDGNWVSAAWTDDSGLYQTTASYHVGPNRIYRDVLHQLWKTTARIMASSGRLSWRLCIAKIGPLGPGEPDTWRAFTSADTTFSLFLTIVSVDPFPHFSPASPGIGVDGGDAPRRMTGMLPHLSATADGCIPSDLGHIGHDVETDENDETHGGADTVLEDAYETVYGVILNRRMRNSYSLLDYRPCLASGMLIGRHRSRFGPAGRDYLDSADETVVSINLVSFWTSGPNAPIPPAPYPNEMGELPRSLCTSGPIHVPASLWNSGSSTPGGASHPSAPQSHAARLRQAPSPSAASSSSNQGSHFQPSTPAPAPTGSTGHLFLWIDTILRNLLNLYRRLGVLSRVRGLIDPTGGLVPWHLLVAMRSVNALELGATVNRSTVVAAQRARQRSGKRTRDHQPS